MEVLVVNKGKSNPYTTRNGHIIKFLETVRFDEMNPNSEIDESKLKGCAFIFLHNSSHDAKILKLEHYKNHKNRIIYLSGDPKPENNESEITIYRIKTPQDVIDLPWVNVVNEREYTAVELVKILILQPDYTSFNYITAIAILCQLHMDLIKDEKLKTNNSLMKKIKSSSGWCNVFPSNKKDSILEELKEELIELEKCNIFDESSSLKDLLLHIWGNDDKKDTQVSDDIVSKAYEFLYKNKIYGTQY